MNHNTETAYSIVIDNVPKIIQQADLFCRWLILELGTSPADIFVHTVTDEPGIIQRFEALGVCVVPVEPFGDGKYCNKITQVDTPALYQYRRVWLCDADILIASSLEDVETEHAGKIVGKTVDFANPPYERLAVLMDELGIEGIPVVTDTITRERTFYGNFNGGLYGIPGSQLQEMGVLWKRWALFLLDNPTVEHILGQFYNHVDQIAFCLALHESRLPSARLSLSYNTPTHAVFPAGGCEVLEPPRVIHYHNKITSGNLLIPVGVKTIDNKVFDVNQQLLQHNIAQETKAAEQSEEEFGSMDIISRAAVTQKNVEKLKSILRSCGLERASSVYDLNPEAGYHLTGLRLQNYTFYEPNSAKAKLLQRRIPEAIPSEIPPEKLPSASVEMVLCLNLDTQIEDGANLDVLLEALIGHATQRVVLLEPDWRTHQKSDLKSVFYNWLDEVCQAVTIGLHAGQRIWVLDLVALAAVADPDAPNQIDTATWQTMLNQSRIPQLLYECALVSQSAFGWYTKHLPRVNEYPWILDRLGDHLMRQKIGDFGAGLSALPLALVNRGAQVVTVDIHSKVVVPDDFKYANEWGYLDYQVFTQNIVSYNQPLSSIARDEDTGSYDAWYSVSVVEHLPAATRRAVIPLFARLTRKGGKLLLTIDVEKRSEQLWNYDYGEQVEDPAVHGTVETIKQELEAAGYVISYQEYIYLPLDQRVDTVLLEAIKHDGAPSIIHHRKPSQTTVNRLDTLKHQPDWVANNIPWLVLVKGGQYKVHNALQRGRRTETDPQSMVYSMHDAQHNPHWVANNVPWQIVVKAFLRKASKVVGTLND